MRQRPGRGRFSVSIGTKISARAITYIGVCLFLPGQVRFVQWQLDSDVQLGVGDLDPKRCVGVDHGYLLIECRRTGRGEMGLHSDATDLDAVVLQQLDDADGAIALVARRFEVVVVVVELDIRVDLASRAKGKFDELFPERRVEDGLAVRPVLVQGFVHNVPSVTFALVVLHDVCDMVDDYRAQVLSSPILRFDPGSQLAVPDQSVASLDEMFLLGDGRHDVAFGEIEDALFRFGEKPLLS